MPNPYFKFKQFTIHQDRCAMKVSTDAVVLGAIANQENPKYILDIGAGTGVIALMMAQRFSNAHIKAVETDEPAYHQALENITDSPWKNSIQLDHKPFQEFLGQSQGQFDLIVSNPPYFPNHNKSTNAQRNLALHNDGLPFGDLIKGVNKLLAKEGQFWVILPPQQMKELEKIAKFFQLSPSHSIALKDRPDTKTLRLIQSFSYQNYPSKTETLCIKNEDFSYSEPYSNLLKDFLLIF
ncbi:methyltransferase [Echinicola jeungdonensis]|uniref:tRNA1(Val) (adenine(37)-N6)-methyltransferase n=1 Tax=Echinicola jeungdonensis TaxID=709343 RepID=A0ABV5J3C6_9BACT|nr:methyltransferase [Echinicola jeungdonensis]MDN3669581.1 methyltransferase [Echinicola jeungdonensis]